MKDKAHLYCDNPMCDEHHPINHEELGEEFFGPGRWLGWVYLDLNRPDLFPRVLRFCSTRCAGWWLERERLTWRREELTPLDLVLRSGSDDIAVQRALEYARRVGPDGPPSPTPPRPRPRRKRTVA